MVDPLFTFVGIMIVCNDNLFLLLNMWMIHLNKFLFLYKDDYQYRVYSQISLSFIKTTGDVLLQKITDEKIISRFITTLESKNLFLTF